MNVLFSSLCRWPARAVFLLAVGLAGACGSSAPDRPATPTDVPAGSTGGSAGSGASSGGATGTTVASRRALLSSTAVCLGADAIGFATDAAALASATATYGAAPDDTNREAARASFRSAMERWQLIEAMPIGPLSPLDVPGGLDLRDAIHAWPLVSRCGVEQIVVSKAYEAPDYVATSLVNTRGLASLEYLLFYEGEDNECSAAASLNSQGTWDALGPQERRARKAKLAALLAADVKVRADALANAWSPAPQGGDFGRTLATAGEGSTVYTTLPKAVNALSDALFYIEHQVKDRKLARPIGLLECETGRCPEKLESRFADRDLAYIRQNVVAFRRAVTGCDLAGGDVGFDDVLRSLGAVDLADRLLAAIDAALAVVDTFPAGGLRASISADAVAATQLHGAIKAITDLLKTEIVTLLDLELPKRIEGDND